MAGLAGFGEEFYEGLYQRGMTHFRAGDYQSSFDELHLAAFGFLDQPEKVETIEIYAALAANRLGNEALTREALIRIVSAEKIQPHFQSVTIPEAVRAEIVRTSEILLTREERSVLRGPAPAASLHRR